MENGIVHGIRSYLEVLFRFCGAKAVTGVFLLILQGLTQGAGILMLIPMLGFTGLAGGGTPGGRETDFMAALFEKLGVVPSLTTVLLTYIFITALYALLNYSLVMLNTGIQQGFTRFLRNRLYAAVAGADWLFITRTRSSDLTHVLTSEIQRVGSGTHFFLTLVGSGMVVTVHIVLSFMMAKVMAGIVMICAAAMILFLRPLNRKALELGKTMRQTNQGIFSIITEYLAGMKVAKSFGSEALHTERFKTVTCRAEGELIRFARIRASSAAFNTVGAVVCISILFYCAVELAEIPPVRLFVLLYLFSRVLPRVSALHQNYQNIVNMLPAFSAVMEMQERCEAAAEHLPQGDAPPLHLEGEIAFQRVSFRYDERREHFALKGLDLSIPARRMTAIVGPSGAGKSTLADLVMGLIPPTKGEIRIDGVRLSGEHLHCWRRSVGYVPQETFLFNDTIRANLLWASPQADEASLRHVLTMAAAQDFVGGLSHGLDTVVGDRGVRLSGGESQRIALARALLRRPELLLLDEATSSLDTENERLIQAAIDRLNGEQTIVVIAHRLSTIRRADHILVLEEGCVVESGTWEELSHREKGRFRAMLRDGGT